MYSIRNLAIEGTSTFMTIVGKRGQFTIEFLPVDVLDASKGIQYCISHASGDDNERAVIIQQLMIDNNLTDL